MTRAFVALEIPASDRAEIGALMTALRPQLPGVRFIAPETVHLTLRFLGESAADMLERLPPHLAAAAAACPASPLETSGLGLFPERGAPRVLWLGTRMPEPLLVLQRAVEAAAVECGFARETKPYRAHLTLGRWRDRVRRPELPPVPSRTLLLESLVLYQSERRPSGAVHTPLAAFSLG
jgi:RNA 2',3'-cyclic 3'-phosphodiesterase